MAIKDTSRKPYIIDRDSNVKVGIDLPIRRGDTKDGWFATTSTTIEAVKNNIRNLLQTNQGERLMQPNLGLDLRGLLFEQIDETTIFNIQNKILDALKIWLPFVEVHNIEVVTNNEDTSVSPTQVLVKIIFNIAQDPNTIDSVNLNFSSEISDSGDSAAGGGGGGY